MKIIFNNIRVQLLLVILSLQYTFLIGQSAPSPNSSGFLKYVDQPVNPLNGTTAFNIPIYTLTEGTISHGVSLSYHTGGIRANEVASPIGAGWNLNAGGVITRIVRGIHDDHHYAGYQNISNPSLQQIADGEKDGEMDLFFYSFNGVTGKFVVDQNGIIQFLNKADISIILHKTSNGLFEGFKVRTSDGTKYYFGNHPEGNGDATEISWPTGGVVGSHKSGFFLTRIESFDKKHQIDFSYVQSDSNNKFIKGCQLVKYLKNGQVNTTYDNCTGDNLFDNRLFSKVISKITTSTCEINFSHKDRLDLLKYDGNVNPKLIDGMEIENGAFCFSYDFTQSYFKDGSPESQLSNTNNSTARRLKLDKIQKFSCSNNSIKENPYVFEYYGSDFLPNLVTTGTDHWGYYNGETGNSVLGLGSATTVNLGNGTTISHFNGDRETDFQSGLNGALKKVTYPTKGSVEYTYESNKGVDYSGNNIYVFSKETCDYPAQACCPSTISTIPSEEAFLLIDNEMIQTGVLTFSSTKSEYCTDPYAIANGNAWAQVKVVDLATNALLHVVGINAGITPDSHASSSFLLADIPGLTVGNQYKFIIQSLYGPGTMSFRYIPASAEQDVGGLRIKEVRVSDGIDVSKDIIKSYEYINSSTGGTSGIVTKKPIYGVALNFHTALFRSAAISQLTSAEGNHITYTEVKESLNGNGFNKYFLDYEFTDQNFTSYPSKPLQSKLRNGKLIKQQSFRIDGNNSILESQSILERNTGDQKGAVAGNNVIAANICLASGSNNCQNTIRGTNYVNEISTYRIKKNTSLLDGVTSITSYAYHSTGAVLSPIKTWTTNSDGKIHETRFKYTVDYDENSSVGWSLFNNFRIGIPYETKQYVGGQFVDGARIIFRTFDSNGNLTWTNKYHSARPWKNQRYERTWHNGNGSLLNGEWRDQMKYFKYNAQGLLKESAADGGWAKTSYTYNSDKLLRFKTYQGHTSEYIYYPGSNLLKKSIAIDGTSTSYLYDALTRLKSRTDDCNSIVETYQYEFSPEGSSLVNAKNYVESTIDYPVKTSSSKIDKVTNRTYLDGLGRAIQTVRVKQSPDSNSANRRDLITSTEYDKYGRIKYNYKQIKSAKADGSYIQPAITWQKSESIYYNSPLNRLKESKPPSWHSTFYSYDSNQNNDDVKLSGTVQKYSVKSLYKKVITSSGGRSSISYSDKLGRNILSRQTNPLQSLDKRLDTYSVFDDKSRLTFVLPPGALTTSGIYSNLYYKYSYDGEDKMLQKKVPGAETVEFIYNTRDINVGYQDGFLRKQNKWYTSSFDTYGRELKQGFFTGTPSASNHVPNDWQIETIYGANEYDKDKVKSVKTKILGSTDFLTSNNNYNSCGILTSQSGNNHINTGLNSITSNHLYDGALNTYYTNSTIKGYGTKNIKTLNRFDHAGRLTTNFMRVDNTSIGWSGLCSRVYNEEDEIVTKYQGHSRPARKWLQKTQFTYKHNGLLTRMNSQALQGAEQAWNDCSPIVLANPGSNIHNSTRDLFYLELYYDTTVPGIPTNFETNGNIAAVKWQVKGRSQGAYTYKYDLYNRLTEADFYDIDDNVISNSGRYDSSYSYDNRGNMTSIQRNGMTDALGCNSYGQIDNLSFSYGANSNRLDNVNDNSGHSEGFENGWGGNYNYDENGNLTWNSDRKLSISYNHLNLPTVIQNFGTGGGYLHFKYDAAGNLLQRKASYTSSGNDPIETIDYVAGVEYKNGKVSQIMHSEGYVQYTNGANPEYHYVIADHLGNTRLIYTDKNQNGKIESNSEIIQENHYYPFGLTMKGVWMGDENNFRYKYNGIEQNSNFGIELSFAHYRTLDPTIGRWMQVDPKTEMMKSYTPFVPVVAAAIIGATVGAGANIWSQYKQGNLNSVGDWIGAGAIGAVAGGAGAVVGTAAIMGGAAFAAAGSAAAAGATGVTVGGYTLGTSGFVSGAISGAASGVVSSPLRQVGNMLAGWQDEFSFKEYGAEIVGGGLFGGLAGGVGAAIKGQNFWWGNSTPLTNVAGLGPTVRTGTPGSPTVSATTDGTVTVATKGGTNSVYQGVDENGVVRYVGITKNDPNIRFGQHLNSNSARSELRYTVIEGTGKMTRRGARILEQQLINKYGLGKNGGQLLNKINSISPKRWDIFGITL